MSEICSICLERTENFLECGHYNCIECLKILVRKTDLCPICRQTFVTDIYKYKRPRHRITLKISKKTKKFFVDFFHNRMFLFPGKRQRFYALLQSSYHSHIFVNGTFLNPIMMFQIRKYEALQYYIYFSSHICIFSHPVKVLFKNAIIIVLCDDINHASFFDSFDSLGISASS